MTLRFNSGKKKRLKKLWKTMISYIFAKNKRNLWKFMKQISVLILLSFFIGCTDDNQNQIFNQKNCLSNRLANPTPNDCKSISTNVCEFIYIGSKRLSEKSKDLFNEFCFGPKSQIVFLICPNPNWNSFQIVKDSLFFFLFLFFDECHPLHSSIFTFYSYFDLK